MKTLLFLFSILTLVLSFSLGCTHGHCRLQREKENAEKGIFPRPVAPKVGAGDRIRVFKSSGSLQCGEGHGIELNEMEKSLQGLQVFDRWKKNDGMMRIQKCGSPTGEANVYEIERSELPKALKLGFQEWIWD